MRDLALEYSQHQSRKQPWFFDTDGWAKYPLYHGTCTYFMESIHTHGLAGRDVVREWRAIEMYRELYEVRHRQKPVGCYKGGAWGYGQTYLTAYTSIAYRNEPELFGLIRADLRRMNRIAGDEILARYPDIAAYLAFQHKPVLLRLPRIHRSNLLGWGSDAPEDSVGEFELFKLALNVSGFQAPVPTFRLRDATFEFEIIE